MAKHILERGFGLGGFLADTLMQVQKGSSFPSSTDSYWMAEAIKVAMKSVGRASPNPTVGCIFVKDSKIIASGATEDFGGLHAERKAIESCQDKSALKDSDCYTTLEPCSHFGKQPPCIDALLPLGIKRCIIALKDPFSEVNGRGIEHLRAHGIEVSVGVLANEAAAWHFPFLLHTKLNRPAIVAKWAQTLDAKLADDQGGSKWITGELARQHTHWLRQRYDAIAVGANTVSYDLPSLNVRDVSGIQRQPVKLVYDPKGQIFTFSKQMLKNLETKLFSGSKCYWGVGEIAAKEGKSELFQKIKNLELLVFGRDLSFLSFLQEVEVCFERDFSRRLQSVMVEGGSRLLSQLFENRLLDAAHVFINPSLLGESRHQLARGFTNLLEINNKIELVPLQHHALGGDLLWDLVSLEAFEQVWKAQFPFK